MVVAVICQMFSNPDIVRNVRADCDWPEFGGAKDPGEGDTVAFHQPFTHCGSGSFPTGCVQRTGQPVDHLSLHKDSNTFKPPSFCINKKVISRWTISNTNLRTLRGAKQQEQNMMNMYRMENMWLNIYLQIQQKVEVKRFNNFFLAFSPLDVKDVFHSRIFLIFFILENTAGCF